MIYLLKLSLKILYWIFIGWWWQPIKFIKNYKYQKMQNEITKTEYQKLQEQKQQENKKSAK